MATEVFTRCQPWLAGAASSSASIDAGWQSV